MSMYQSASRPEESVTFPCTTASSTMSFRSRLWSGSVAGAVMRSDPRHGRAAVRRESDDGPGSAVDHMAAGLSTWSMM